LLKIDDSLKGQYSHRTRRLIICFSSCIR